MAEAAPERADISFEVEVVTASDNQPPNLVVGIGASAGGLAAFKTFLAHTPADTGMAFVLVQHLAPDYKSLLVELLRRAEPHSRSGSQGWACSQRELCLRYPAGCDAHHQG